MRRVAAIITIFSMVCFFSGNSEAQVRETVVVEGPALEFGIPPLLWVRVGPVPILRFTRTRAHVVHEAPPPPPPPPREPPPPPVRVYVVRPEAAPPPPPPPPPRRQVVYVAPPPPVQMRAPQRLGLTLGGFLDTAMYSDGQLAGAGLEMRWRFSRSWALTGTISGMGSCTHCDRDTEASRADFNWSVGVMWLITPHYWISPYLRGGVVFNHATYKYYDATWRVSQAGMDFGFGLEWRFNRWLALIADANVMALGPMRDDSTVNNPLVVENESDWKGIPRSSDDDVAARLRLGLVIKF